MIVYHGSNTMGLRRMRWFYREVWKSTFQKESGV